MPLEGEVMDCITPTLIADLIIPSKEQKDSEVLDSEKKSGDK